MEVRASWCLKRVVDRSAIVFGEGGGLQANYIECKWEMAMRIYEVYDWPLFRRELMLNDLNLCCCDPRTVIFGADFWEWWDVRWFGLGCTIIGGPREEDQWLLSGTYPLSLLYTNTKPYLLT